jgi:hypothetical protein
MVGGWFFGREERSFGRAQYYYEPKPEMVETRLYEKVLLYYDSESEFWVIEDISVKPKYKPIATGYPRISFYRIYPEAYPVDIKDYSVVVSREGLEENIYDGMSIECNGWILVEFGDGPVSHTRWFDPIRRQTISVSEYGYALIKFVGR